ncbi:MAG: hypothetical protein LLG44_03920 [Chloroflexi bacterium]|nr:hypothetical protein [Chloroflexota bacterium]
MNLSAAQFERLEERVRASFSTREAAEGALELLPAITRLTAHLLRSDTDIVRLSEVLQPILMELPSFACESMGTLWRYDLAPLALAAHKSSDLTDLLRRFMPGRESELMAGLLARCQGSGQPFDVPAEYFRAELPAANPEQALCILSRLGAGALPANPAQAFNVLIAGVNVWGSYHSPEGRLALEVHDPSEPYTITRQAFEHACAVNQALLEYALSRLMA